MTADFLDRLAATAIAVGFAIVGVILVRTTMRRLFGAGVVYALWIAVPLALVAVLLPAGMQPVSSHALTLRSDGLLGAVEHVNPLGFDARLAVLIVWVCGAAVAMIALVRQQRRFERGLGGIAALDEGVFVASSSRHGPALVGALHPRIVVPADFQQRYTARERELILAHERLHRARGDTRINAVVALLRCVYWFNPLLHWASIRFRFDQELACDAGIVSRFPQARRSYADAMLKTQLAEQSWPALRLPVGCLWPCGHPLKKRLLMLKQPLPSRARSGVGLVLVVLSGFGGGYVAWASQPDRAPRATDIGPNQVEAQLSITAGSGDAMRLRMVNPVGVPFIVESTERDAWKLEFTAAPSDHGTIEFSGRIFQNAALVSAPTLVVKPGAHASLEVARSNAGPAMRIAFTLAIHDGTWKVATEDALDPAHPAHAPGKSMGTPPPRPSVAKPAAGVGAR